MTAHPQTQPLPGTLPASPAAPPVTQTRTSKPKGAGRNARIALGLSVLVATAGVSFAIGHVTAEGAASMNAAPVVGGTVPFASGGVAQAAADTEVAQAASGDEVSAADGALPGDTGPGTGAGGSGLAAAAGADIDSDSGVASGTSSIELVEAAQAEPAGPPDAGAGGRPGFGGAPAGSKGTVAEITDAALTITAADGTEQTFVIDGSTSWVQQAAIDASVVQLGDTVSVEIPFGRGAAESDSSVATQVVVSSTT